MFQATNIKTDLFKEGKLYKILGFGYGVRGVQFTFVKRDSWGKRELVYLKPGELILSLGYARKISYKTFDENTYAFLYQGKIIYWTCYVKGAIKEIFEEIKEEKKQ